MSWTNKSLSSKAMGLEYGPVVGRDGHVVSPAGHKASREMTDWARLVLGTPDLLRRFEAMLDARANCTEEEKRRVMLSLKRMAGGDDADDLAPIVEAFRRLTAEFRT